MTCSMFIDLPGEESSNPLGDVSIIFYIEQEKGERGETVGASRCVVGPFAMSRQSGKSDGVMA